MCRLPSISYSSSIAFGEPPKTYFSAKAGGQVAVQHCLGAAVVATLSPEEVDSLEEAKVSTGLWARSYAMVLLKGLCSGWKTGWPFPFPELLQLC